MTSVVVGCFVVPDDHPSLPGHFPNRPIVPGVVLLDMVLTLVLPRGQRAAALTGVKLTGAVCAGETVEVSAVPPRPGPMGVTVAFSATARGHAVLRGAAVLAAQ